MRQHVSRLPAAARAPDGGVAPGALNLPSTRLVESCQAGKMGAVVRLRG